jgi:hypothetical protein
MNGEENAQIGRAFAHLITGPSAGHTYELPRLGKASWENAVACPAEGQLTMVALLDDAGPGEIYFYIGTKNSSGNEIEKAGLTNGKLFGLAVTGLSNETNSDFPAQPTAFSLVDLGDASQSSGSALQQLSTAKKVTTFLRPEDGAWDPAAKSDFYFATTNGYGSPSRLYRVRFTDISDPLKGGTISAVLKGNEGQQMMDNIAITSNGFIMIQEDIGDTPERGRMWRYEIASGILKSVAIHNPEYFSPGKSSFLTQNEESSGIIDAQAVLGPGMFIFTDQAHYGEPFPVYEGGQLLAMYDPKVADELTGATVAAPGGQRLLLYPNPSDDISRLQISSEEDENISVSLYDITGRKVIGEGMPVYKGATSIRIETATLSSGIYHLVVTTGKDRTTLKLAVHHQ